MSPELIQWLPPAVIVGVMLYLHRLTRSDIMDLRNRMTRLEERMIRLEERMTRLEERTTRLEGTLDFLQQFLVRNGRGTAA